MEKEKGRVVMRRQATYKSAIRPSRWVHVGSIIDTAKPRTRWSVQNLLGRHLESPRTIFASSPTNGCGSVEYVVVGKGLQTWIIVGAGGDVDCVALTKFLK